VLERIRSRIRRWRMKTLKPFAGPGPGLRLSLVDRSPAVSRALAGAFADVPAAEVVEGDLLDLSCEAVVAPANSFGDMSGGLDKIIDDFHGGAAQDRLRSAIAEHFLGELPVGVALIVEIPAPRFSLVVAAPTMRVAGSVAGSINAYLALRAALVAVLRFSGRAVRTLAVPGLCTGVGGLDPDDAAEQMRAAYDNVAGGRWREVLHPVQAPYALRGVRLRV
jgi:O-acetyl-ADP-ribose deacetylase (regulator of RNase III)